MSDDLWAEFDQTPAAPEHAPDTSAAHVYLLGGTLLDSLLQAHHDDPSVPILMLAPELPGEVLKSVILAALPRIEPKL